MYFCTENDSEPPDWSKYIRLMENSIYRLFRNSKRASSNFGMRTLPSRKKKWIFKIGNYLTISPLNRLSHVSKYIGGAF